MNLTIGNKSLKILKPLFWVCDAIISFFKPKYWIVKKCGFQYNEGYVTYNWKTHTVLDT